MNEFNCFDPRWAKIKPSALEEIMEQYQNVEFWVPFRKIEKGLGYRGEEYEEDGRKIRHGMGELYSTDGFGREIIRYRGLFLCGAIHCEAGELYDYAGKLEFKGKVFGGRRFYGKEYHYNGEIRYEGYFKNDKPNGKDCILYDIRGKIEFHGEVNCGRPKNNFDLKKWKSEREIRLADVAQHTKTMSM